MWPSELLALETGDDDDVARVEEFVDLLGRDVVDLGLGMDAVGHDAGLGAGEGDGGDIDGVKGDGRERDRLLFAGGEEHVHLAFAGQRREVLGEFDEAVGHAAHGRDDDDQLVAAGAVFGHAPGDVLEAVRVADGGSAVLLDDQGHGMLRPAGARRLGKAPRRPG